MLSEICCSAKTFGTDGERMRQSAIQTDGSAESRIYWPSKIRNYSKESVAGTFN